MGLISDELFEVKINPIIKSKFETLSFVWNLMMMSFKYVS
jgi:hypothetical protein